MVLIERLPPELGVFGLTRVDSGAGVVTSIESVLVVLILLLSTEGIGALSSDNVMASRSRAGANLRNNVI